MQSRRFAICKTNWSNMKKKQCRCNTSYINLNLKKAQIIKSLSWVVLLRSQRSLRRSLKTRMKSNGKSDKNLMMLLERLSKNQFNVSRIWKRSWKRWGRNVKKKRIKRKCTKIAQGKRTKNSKHAAISCKWLKTSLKKLLLSVNVTRRWLCKKTIKSVHLKPSLALHKALHQLRPK